MADRKDPPDKQRATTARRRARLRMGSPPPARVITPKAQKPPKHKKKPDADSAQD